MCLFGGLAMLVHLQLGVESMSAAFLISDVT